jgi:UDP-N-acetylglucosamine 2-epimerase
MKIILVAGARPNFMKIAPIICAIKSFNRNQTNQRNQRIERIEQRWRLQDLKLTSSLNMLLECE